MGVEGGLLLYREVRESFPKEAALEQRPEGSEGWNQEKSILHRCESNLVLLEGLYEEEPKAGVAQECGQCEVWQEGPGR